MGSEGALSLTRSFMKASWERWSHQARETHKSETTFRYTRGKTEEMKQKVSERVLLMSFGNARLWRGNGMKLITSNGHETSSLACCCDYLMHQEPLFPLSSSHLSSLSKQLELGTKGEPGLRALVKRDCSRNVMASLSLNGILFSPFKDARNCF